MAGGPQMTHSREFIEQYPKNYGASHSQVSPDFSRCAETVNTTPNERFSHFAQCSRKNGHGPHGAWCKQHDPVAVKTRKEAREKKWENEWADSARKRAFELACQGAIRQIAEGHNDPRALAQSIIDALEARK
jgi:hypothetical protein